MAALAGSGGWVVILLIAAGATTVHSVMNVFATTRKSRAWAQEQWDMRYADAFYHRKYIVPRTDLDDEARPIWARAVAAANEIRESYVVKSHIVDSVQVAKALPQWLWEIADGLAALSQVRGLQREILRQDGSKAEQVTAKVSAQGREINAESRRLERRVRKLEETAGLMRDADAAKLPEMVVERLGGVDDLLGDLSARSAGIDALPDLDPTERLRLAAQVVIELANEAIRDLALPDLGEEEDSDANDDPGADDNA